MEIFETNGEFYQCKDLATIKSLGWVCSVRKHKLNDTPRLSVHRELEDVFITDAYGYELQVLILTELVEEKVNDDIVCYHQLNAIKISGQNLDDIDLSKDLKSRIIAEVGEAIDYMDEKMRAND